MWNTEQRSFKGQRKKNKQSQKAEKVGAVDSTDSSEHNRATPAKAETLTMAMVNEEGMSASFAIYTKNACMHI